MGGLLVVVTGLGERETERGREGERDGRRGLGGVGVTGREEPGQQASTTQPGGRGRPAPAAGASSVSRHIDCFLGGSLSATNTGNTH